MTSTSALDAHVESSRLTLTATRSTLADLDFEAGSASGRVVAAYRRWMGR